ncbi:MAG: HTH domain-containing protein, partial [Bacillota bacterium]
MSKKVFTEKEIVILSRNPYVKSVSPKGITYSEEFKQHFISEYHKGKFPRDIFEEAGFDINILGIKRVTSSSERWRRAYDKDGDLGLKDSRSESLGRLKKNELSLEEKNARLEAQINLLKAENELLKKIRMAERG